MKAVALTGLRKLELIEVPMPALSRETDVLLKIKQVGICGSDMHYFETGRIAKRAVQFPFVLGHEFSATVTQTGRAVTRVQPGELVAVDPAISCYQCDQCRQGRPHTCRHLKFLGCPGEVEGCMSEYFVMPETSLYPVKGLTPEQAALCEPFSIGIYAVRLAQLAPGADIAILGSGPIGLCVLLAAQYARPCRVWMTDRIDARVHSARTAGAYWAGNPDHQDIVAAILSQQPTGLDAVFECAGQQETLDQALALLKPGGKLAIVGIPRVDRVSFDIDLMRRKEINILNVRRQNHCFQPAIDLVRSGQVKVDFLLTHRFKPEQSQAAFELVADYRDGVLKAMVEFGG